MTIAVTGLWRFPIKSHGREQLHSVTLAANRTMPGDRVWAVAHDRAQTDGSAWASCANFLRIASHPALAAITAETAPEGNRITLYHPERLPLDFAPDSDTEAYLDWIGPLLAPERAAPARIVRVHGRGMTDSDFPSVTLCNMSSHRAVAQRLGHDLSIHRWRGNIWFDGAALWEEFDWVGREVRIGDVRLSVEERTDRCRATEANPDTGRRDAAPLQALASWGHEDFSVRARVIDGGTIRIGDAVEPL